MDCVEELAKSPVAKISRFRAPNLACAAQSARRRAMTALSALPTSRARCGWVESERGFPNQRDFDSTCWLGGGQQEMAKPYSQDLRDRVIDAVKKGEMSRRAAARRYEISESVAIKWLERVERDGSRAPVGHGGHRASKLMPHRDFLEAARAEKSDVTLQALCDRLSAERGVKADTSMMSRFFRRIGVTVKKRPLSRASRIAQTSAATANDGEPIRASSTPGGWSSSMKPGPRPT
jgi:transposase